MSEEDMLKEIRNLLYGSYSELGIEQWWSRARVPLGGRTPREAWADGDHALVLHLARSLQ